MAVDKAAGRLSLGLKPSYFEDLSDVEEEADGEAAQGPDFDEELEAAMGDGGGDGSEGEDEEMEDDSDAAGVDEFVEEEPGSDFDLDEELMDAEAEEGSDEEEEDGSGSEEVEDSD